MSDGILLVIGCGITFIAAAGAYVALRSGFAYGGVERAARSEPATASRPAPPVETARAQ
jgi:hypothetical protein